MRIFLSIILLLFPLGANAAKILASTTHIASIISMISDDVEVLASGNSCPAHYSLKPSDIAKIEEADLIIYIDDRFESSAEAIKKKANAKMIKISELEGVNIRKGNFHIWLNIDVAKRIIKEVSKELEISSEKAISALDELAIYKKSKLASIKESVLLSDSLEYLFDNTSIKPTSLYLDNGSVNLIARLESLDQKPTIFADSSCNYDSIGEKTSKKITYIDSDKWPSAGYVAYYRSIIDGISNGSIQNTTHK